MTPEFDRDSVKKIVVIRLDRVGDLILSTPFFRNLRDQFPGAEISAVVTPYTREVLEGNPCIDSVISYSGKKTFKRIFTFTRPLARTSPDCAIALSPVSSAYMMAFLSGAPIRIGYVYSRRWLTRIFAGSLLTHVNVYTIDEALERGETILHEVEQTLALLEALGLQTVPYGLELYPGTEAERFAIETITSWASPKKIVGLHLSKKWLTGSWNLGHILVLIYALIQESDDRMALITYGTMEKDLGKEIGELLKNEKRIRVVGDLPFKKWAALIGHCQAFLTTDTGALHCAAAMKVPVLAVYEERSFNHCSRQWAPWKNPGLVFKKEMPAETIAALTGGARRFLDMPAGTSCKE